MEKFLKKRLEQDPIEASAPCRIDMGGTLDISTFYFPLRHYFPCTVNLALNMRTKVRIAPYRDGVVKISSAGFKSAEYPVLQAPMKHPLGLVFAIAAWFGQGGIHIEIESASPPKSALGGSSAAAVALIAALSNAAGNRILSPRRTALLGHAIEGSVAGVPCGIQDHLAAAFGGANLWIWDGSHPGPVYRKKRLFQKKEYPAFENRLLLAYCGRQHVSAEVNSRWIRQFMAGKNRTRWIEIIGCTRGFADAVSRGDISGAADWMNRETAIRRRMTPDVLDPVGKALVRAALDFNCGARFTGAGGGGCIWAIGHEEKIEALRERWHNLLSRVPSARLLAAGIDSRGVTVK